jgi:hexosaminidase
VQLTGTELERAGRKYPRAARGIPVGKPIRQLHLLFSTAYAAPDGTQVGSVVLRYADGARLELPIRYGEHVRDWWQATDPRTNGPKIAWTGENRASRAGSGKIRLYHATWKNPIQEHAVDRIDILSAGANAAPFIVGMTVE